MKTTNVKPSELNYDRYTTDKYDQDIVNSIPYHREIHELIANYIQENFENNGKYSIIDLGTGTAITSRIIKDILPKAEFDLVDFSEQMLEGAKKKMGEENVNYIFGDYSQLVFQKQYDIALTVIGLHHQNIEGKKAFFKNVYSVLKPGGVFIFGDLVTYQDKETAALNHAKHYKELVDKSSDEKTLAEWAHHHMYLNDLSPIEDQIEWLKECGFSVDQKFLKINTSLIIAKK